MRVGLEPFFYLWKATVSMVLQEQLKTLLAPEVESLGFEFWGVEVQIHPKSRLLRIYIDGDDGVTVEDCANVSRQVSAVLDVEDLIPGEYRLEISSPGMDRPLFTLEQYGRYLGETITLKLNKSFEGRKKYKGVLSAVENDEITIIYDDFEYTMPFEWVEKANVVPRFNRCRRGKV
jgi:ribosome maturation factor RimP